MTTWSLGEGGNSFSFDNVGDYVSGTVLDLKQVQQTDMDTGAPAFWDNGDPKMMFSVTLQTELRDPNNPGDDGKRTVALAGSKKPESLSRIAAVLAAVQAATGGRDLAYGGKLTIQYIGDGVPSRKGFNAPKQYQAWYEAPAMALDQPAEHQQPAPAAAAPQPTVAQTIAQQGPPPTFAQPDAPAAPPAAPPVAPVAPPVAPVAPPAATQPPAGPPPVAPPAAPAGAQHSPEAIAALRAAGIDPATVPVQA